MPRLFRLALLTLLLAAGVQSATAQTANRSAQGFFDSAAQAYIGGDAPQAKEQIEAGLRAYPSDLKLQALREKLEQDRQQQQGGGSGSQGQPQDQNQNDAQSGEQDEPTNKDQQAGDEPQDEQDEQEPQPGNEPPEDEETPDEPQDGQQASSGAADEPPDESNRLTRQQAQRILQAMQNQEKQLLRQVQKRGGRSSSVEKDW